MSKAQIGIIGLGDFSRLMIRYLEPYAEIVVSTRQSTPDISGLNCRIVDETEALARPIVIPSMPAQFLEEYFSRTAQLLKPDTLVIDVCSVKVKPVAILQKLLPDSVSLLATHPMFGPASAAKTLAGQRIMMHPVRMQDTDYQRMKQFVAKLGLQVIECTPEEHDRIMAYVQGLSHYIGRVMDIMKIPETELMTNAYADLLDMKKIQGQDSWELFRSIMFENPYAMEVHDRFEQACQELDKRLHTN